MEARSTDSIQTKNVKVRDEKKPLVKELFVENLGAERKREGVMTKDWRPTNRDRHRDRYRTPSNPTELLKVGFDVKIRYKSVVTY